MNTNNNNNNEEISLHQYICDNINQKTYKKESLLGRGGFGEYYKVTNISSKDTYTAKFILKIPNTANNWEDKISTEVSIHKSLTHKHIVKLHSYFDDIDTIYILSEPCSQITLLDLIKVRKVLTNPEVRYYMKQIILAIKYLHDQGIIHRDLKLGSVFVTNDMIIKVGDVGYATIINSQEGKLHDHYGSPNYAAPEMLDGSGYGQEVDIWAFGCIMYALIVGQLPFLSSDVEEIYTRILLSRYTIPKTVHLCAASILRRVLCRFPQLRPKASSLSEESFFQNGFTPKFLPQSALKSPPFQNNSKIYNGESSEPLSFTRTYLSSPRQCNLALDRKSEERLTHLKNQLLIALSFEVKGRPLTDYCNEVLVPKSLRWISSWVDMSDDYGFAYKMNDGSTGILFVDGTVLILYNKNKIFYVNEDGSEELCDLDSYPFYLKQKINLYEMFAKQLHTTCQDTFQNHSIKKNRKEGPPIGYVINWICYKNKAVMVFSNGMIQISYVSDNVMVVVCPFSGILTFTEKNCIPHTFSFELIENNGCTKELERKIWYVWREIHEMIKNKTWLIVQMN